MAVTLQVVGLYYKQPLDMGLTPGQTVNIKQVLDFAQANPQGQYALSYGVGQGAGAAYVDFIMTDINGQFSSPVSGTRYNGGQFSLTQTFTGVGKGNYTVWQYYVQDQNNQPVKLPTGAETPFETANVVQDGFTVIWRLVEICNAVPVMVGDTAVGATASEQAGPRMNARLAKVVGKPAVKA
ncbi:hypothetical protein AFCDBAGC_5093 [Methylobacterium cerastii]|uniref:Uncharacterized protein n=2 Tax=Methylobacterium TaxID=407 RepID=A0ABQ4QPT1_9HYPH|nr:hypothetical protein [Methylobacterium cerastii]TXN08278.1 hypothetical protein FV219_07650 [Methylobacterium sp. WL122]GJD47207.1 hypothetical protein AFCDBAGC_5093 [Methylobacterium cerastii]